MRLEICTGPIKCGREAMINPEEIEAYDVYHHHRREVEAEHRSWTTRLVQVEKADYFAVQMRR
jgi:hypothetical protein